MTRCYSNTATSLIHCSSLTGGKHQVASYTTVAGAHHDTDGPSVATTCCAGLNQQSSSVAHSRCTSAQQQVAACSAKVGIRRYGTIQQPSEGDSYDDSKSWDDGESWDEGKCWDEDKCWDEGKSCSCASWDRTGLTLPV